MRPMHEYNFDTAVGSPPDEPSRSVDHPHARTVMVWPATTTLSVLLPAFGGTVQGVARPRAATLFIRNVTFMTTEPRRLADFWQAALALSERRDDEGETIVADASWSLVLPAAHRSEGDRVRASSPSAPRRMTALRR